MPKEFRVFDYLDTAIVESESRDEYASQVPAVWPSEASAVHLNPSKATANIVGKCHRAAFNRMIGTKVSNKVDAIGAWRWVIGRQIESHLTNLTQLTKPASIFVASGVRTYIPELYLPLEIDLVVKDPVTNMGWIVECKTNYGYISGKELDKVGPKLENLMQICMYLDQVRTGARLKELIKAGVADRDSKIQASNSRNRIIADMDNVNSILDGQIGAKLAYISRDDGKRREFTVSIEEDFDGTHYPTVDGQPWKIFTMESIWERYRILQGYWFRARQAAHAKLAEKGINPPESLLLVLKPGDVRDGNKRLTPEEQVYIDKLAEETRRLPPKQYWPPAEYEWSYPDNKIEDLASKGLIGKTKYADWKKKKVGKTRIGDWHCEYCPFKSVCIPLVYPHLQYPAYDMFNMNMDDLAGDE